MNSKKAKMLRKAIRDFDKEFGNVPVAALKQAYKDMKRAYKRGAIG